MPITAINDVYNLSNRKYSIKSGKKISPDNKIYTIPTGVNYDILNDMDLTRERTVYQMAIAKAKSGDISEEREKLILSRIKTAQDDAAEFCRQHHQFDYDDVCQDLITYVVKMTDSSLNSILDNSTKYWHDYSVSKKRYFQKLLDQHSEQQTCESMYTLKKENETHKLTELAMLREVLDSNIKDVLTPDEAQIIHCKYGFNGNAPMVYREIGKLYNVTGTRIEQIVKEALDKLKEADFYEELLD